MSRADIPTFVRRAKGSRSLAEFGAECGVSKWTVWKWVAGRRLPRSDLLTELLRRYPEAAVEFLASNGHGTD